jgi:hypothetical protein
VQERRAEKWEGGKGGWKIDREGWWLGFWLVFL